MRFPIIPNILSVILKLKIIICISKYGIRFLYAPFSELSNKLVLSFSLTDAVHISSKDKTLGLNRDEIYIMKVNSPRIIQVLNIDKMYHTGEFCTC